MAVSPDMCPSLAKRRAPISSSAKALPRSTVENDIGIICACLPTLAPLRNTHFFRKMVPDSLQYLLRKSGYTSSKVSTSKGPSSKVSSRRMGYQVSDSGVELVDAPKGDTHISSSDDKTHDVTQEHGTIRREVDMEVVYSKQRNASDRV